MSAVLGFRRHLMNFWRQVFLLLLSQGVEVPSFQQFSETSVYVYPTFADSWISGPHQLFTSVLQKIPKPSISGPFLSNWFFIVFWEDSNSHQVWAVRPTIIKSVAGVSRLKNVSLQCLRKAFTPLRQRGIHFLPMVQHGRKMKWRYVIKLVPGSKKGRLPGSKNSHNTHIFLELWFYPSSKSSSSSQGFSSAAAT